MSLALLAAEGRYAAPIMLVPVAILGIAGAWRALTPGMTGWDFTGDAILDSVRGSGPAAAGLTAWLTIASERSGLGRLERLGRRSAAAGPLIRLGVAASAALAGYTLTAGAIAAWTGAQGPITGSFPPQELAAGAAALLAHVALGFLVAMLWCARCYPVRPGQPFPAVGAAVAAAAVPAAAATASWALAAWSGTGRGSGASLPSMLWSPDVHHSPFTDWRSGLFVAALTWFCGLAAAAIVAAGLILTRRHRYAIGLAAASIVAVVGLGQLRADTGHPITPVTASVVCRSWPLEVCVYPAFASALPRLESAFTAVAAQVSGTPAAVRSIVQLPPGDNASQWPGGYGFHLDDLGPGYELRAESDLVRQVTGALNRANRSRASPDQTHLNRTPLGTATLRREPVTADIGAATIGSPPSRRPVTHGGADLPAILAIR
ncbi:MAG TPA: hypothetical protein VLW50_34175 [Streptosporangiaceae bacterium]|nr:hypothetical protein [Streptosporangiaceae bacterium]